ncbi:MAG: site-2 protease family protein [Treponema sp.]|jgi:regulator of sigma E protease|nr:site-2 protease family protein [Treponema sp.]
MLILKIALGLFGLGIVVFVHELGHFLAARWMGIGVEAFSIGWGKPILKKKVGDVEYRLGMFPLGGYCKMRGENEFREAWESNASGVEPVKGTYFGASPWRRIVVCFAGPFFNLVFAALVMSFIWGFGFEVQTQGNRIVLASEFDGGGLYPADEAGLRSGDRIIEIDGKEIKYFHEIRRSIAINPDKQLSLAVYRQGEIIYLAITPELDKSTGAGRIGIMPWSDPVVADIVPASDAAIAGLAPGDRIIRVNGEPVVHTLDIFKALSSTGPVANSATAAVDYVRDEIEASAEIALSQDGESSMGIIFPHVQYRTPNLSPPAALAKGVSESWNTLVISLRSLALLFKGIELTNAVSGPVRITYMVGDVAAAGFGQSFSTGLRSMAEFLALISIALCIMNLLPLPILDGGMIVLFIVEIARRKPLHPKTINVFQTVGAALVFGIMIFAIFGDIQYLARR